MQPNDSTGDKIPDRSTESHPTYTDGGTPTHSIHDRLTTIDRVTRALLVAIHRPRGTAIADVDEETRAKAASHVRQIRAEASQVGLSLLGPTATMHYSPFAEDAGAGPIAAREGVFTTTHDGPDPETYERERDRSPSDDDHDPIRSQSEADRPDETTGNEGGDDDE